MWFFFAVCASLSWALTNVLDSVLINRYEDDSVVLMWTQSVINLLILCFFPFFVDLQSDWIQYLLLVGVLVWGGVLFYYFVLKRLDVSVMNAAWAIQAIVMSVAGFMFFAETWTSLETLGAIFILIGVFYLSFWHQHVSLLRTILLLAILALFFTPQEVIQKAGLLQGEELLMLMFWPPLMRNALSFCGPLFLSRYRTKIAALLARVDKLFYLLNILACVTAYLGFFFILHAYDRGPISLVAIAGNVQPFFVIFYAWVLSKLSPHIAPRELLTRQSIQVKLISFLIVFVGLGLLAVG